MYLWSIATSTYSSDKYESQHFSMKFDCSYEPNKCNIFTRISPSIKSPIYLYKWIWTETFNINSLWMASLSLSYQLAVGQNVGCPCSGEEAWYSVYVTSPRWRTNKPFVMTFWCGRGNKHYSERSTYFDYYKSVYNVIRP